MSTASGTIPDLGGTTIRIRQETQYPWQGTVKLSLHPAAPAQFTLAIRIPDRTESELYTATPERPDAFGVSLNGQPQTVSVQKGYAALHRTWQAGDRVELSLPMDVQRVRCDARVAANRGRVAVQRGPLVYNFEDVDHPRPVSETLLKPGIQLTPVWKNELLGGVMVLEGGGLTAVPNYARLNRGGASQVWLLESPAEQ